MKQLSADKQHEIMTQSPVFKLVITMSLPTVASQLMTVIYNTADTWFVSRISTSASAAIGVVFSIMSIIQAFGFSIGMGTSSLISICLGKKENEQASVYAVSGILLSVILGTIVGILGLVFLEPLMKLLGASDTMLPYACDYAEYIFIAAPVMCCSFVLNNILRGEGEANLSMIGLCSGGILNIILDPVFIFRCNLGIKGAAISTAISQIFSFVILVIFFVSGKSIIRLNTKNLSKNIGTYVKIITTGIPTVFRQSLGGISSALLNRKARIYGDFAVAGVTIASKVYIILRNIILGIGQGYMPVAGYNYGAGIKSRTKKSFNSAVILGTIVCVLFLAFSFPLSEEIIRWFRNDPKVIEVGAESLKYFCIAMPLLAYSTYVNQLYQSLGFKIKATFLASCRQGIFFIPILFILTHFYGIFGIQSVQAVSDICTFAISVPFQIMFFKKNLSDN